MILRRADIRKSPLALVDECRVLTVALFSQERGRQVSLVIAIPGAAVVIESAFAQVWLQRVWSFQPDYELGRLKRGQSGAIRFSRVF